MLPQPLRDAAQARYAAGLSRLANRAGEVARRLILDGIAQGLPITDIADQLRTLIGAATEAGADLAASHLEILTGAAGGPFTTPTTGPVTLDSTLDPAWLADASAALVENAVFQGAAAGSESWAATSGVPIRFWARVLSAGEVCGLCVQAATRIYKTANLAPIHDFCRCTIRPILPPETLTEFKSAVLPTLSRVNAELAARAAVLGPPTTKSGSRSRSSNVRLTVGPTT